MNALVKTLMVLSLVASLVFTLSATAREDESNAAHFGVSYVLTMVSYGALTSLGMPKFPARLFSAVIVGVGTTMKEFYDFQPNANDVKWNVFGIGAAVGTTYIFKF